LIQFLLDVVESAGFDSAAVVAHRHRHPGRCDRLVIRGTGDWLLIVGLAEAGIRRRPGSAEN
jgi:hypothetical protein